jgi:hypothetical protein
VNTSDFSYDHGYLGLLSTAGGIIGLIVCCAVSISWRIDDLLDLLAYRQPDHLMNIKISSKTNRTYRIYEEGWNIWLPLPYKNSITEKILDYGYQLASIAQTFSYRINLLLADGL